MMPFPSVRYHFPTPSILDHYAYIKSGLVKVADSESRLIELIRNPKALMPAIETLQFYNASCGTQLEGHLGEAIAASIHHILDDNVALFDQTYGYITVAGSLIHEISTDNESVEV